MPSSAPDDEGSALNVSSPLVDGLHESVASLLRSVSADVILPRFKKLKHVDIFEKRPGEVVTIVDRESEQLLTSRLLALCPEARVIGEEACETAPHLLHRMDKGLVWIVDPLDGTPNFAAGRPPFGIIIALAQDGETIAGWLYDPLSDRLCFATKDRGAWVSHGDRPAGRLVVTPAQRRPVASLATQFMPADIREEIVQSGEGFFELRPIPRCAAEHYPRLCLGENDVALFQRTLPWDHAAGSLLLIEAGGHVARWNGRPYRFYDNDVGILATVSETLWHEAAAALFGKECVRDYAHSLNQLQDD